VQIGGIARNGTDLAHIDRRFASAASQSPRNIQWVDVGRRRVSVAPPMGHIFAYNVVGRRPPHAENSDMSGQ